MVCTPGNSLFASARLAAVAVVTLHSEPAPAQFVAHQLQAGLSGRVLAIRNGVIGGHDNQQPAM